MRPFRYNSLGQKVVPRQADHDLATDEPGDAASGRRPAGDDHTHERLWSAIYHELRSIARHQMAGDAPGQTLQPTALVHEAYLRLIGSNLPPFDNRKLFFAAAGRIMRQIRVDYAR